MRKFKLSKAADADLRSISDYTLKSWGKAQRNTYIQAFFEAFDRLASTPQIATEIHHIRAGYRKFPQGSHVIYFIESNAQEIVFIRVLHKRMDVDTNITFP